VLRVAGELRRGTPVLLTGGRKLVILAAETASPQAIAEFEALAGAPAVALLAPTRAAAVLYQPVVPSAPAIALRLPGPPTAELLRAVADPTAGLPVPEPLESISVPDLAAAALALA
jgi:GTP cyclohydrolase II